MVDILLDSFLDTIKTLPFLLGAYLLIEWIAHRAGHSFKTGLRRMGAFGPLGGAALGLVPQCGFSVAAANFYADRIITPGTLLAVFAATSDEAIPVMLGNPGSGPLIAKLMGVKLVLAVCLGIFVDLGLRKIWKPTWDEESELQHDHVHMRNMAASTQHVHERRKVSVKRASVSGNSSKKRPMRELTSVGSAHPHHEGCDHSHCDHCDNQLCEHCCSHTHCHGSIWKTALNHTWKVALLIFVVSAFLNLGLEALGAERTEMILMGGTVFQPVAAAAFGLIPSCASSVVVTELYLEGSISFASAMAGLVTGAGTGILILLQAVRNKKECVVMLGGLFAFGALAGIVMQLMG